ncbi:MAG: hypothetical protein QXO01_02440 [Nitrososphaerota archaeon]
MLEIAKLLYFAFSNKEPVNSTVHILNIDEDVAIVSDLHLFKTKNPKLLGSFLRSSGIRNLVIAGDMFDDLKGTMTAKELRPYLQAALRYLEIPEGSEIHYVVSKHSHDPTPLPDTQNHRFGNILVNVYSRPLILRKYSCKIFCTHGDEFVKKGYVAYTINMLAKAMGHELFVEKLSKERIMKSDDVWFVMGHTHFPGIEERNKLANTGGWASPIRKTISTTLTITDGGVRLVSLGR